MKKQFFIVLSFFCLSMVRGQVNLQTGASTFSLPVFSYKDNFTSMTFDLSISYTSNNGLLVDEVPSCIGQGWNLSGLGVITRIENGLPDDQMEIDGNWNIPDKYPPGYLYNSKPVSSGCPKLLMNYPTFENKDVLYKDNNVTMADREQDIFIYSFNGKTGRFVIDKNSNAIVLNDTRIKIILETGFTAGTRTGIKKFIITDESGLKYEFEEKELSKTYDYYPDSYSMSSSTNSYTVNKPHEVPANYNPYVVKNWYLTKIVDSKTARSILINYVVSDLEMFGPLDIQYRFSSGINSTSQNGQYSRKSISITKIKNNFKKPEISKVTFPDNSYIEFNYGPERFDNPGSHKLDNISVYNYNSERISKTTFTQKYFVKNTIVDADASNSRWSRLCLTSLSQFGKTDNDKTNPFNFEYYLGDNATENFVPPIFFHAKDPWGYYNGNYSGTPLDMFLDETNLYNAAAPPFPTYAHAIALYNTPEINNTFPGAVNFESDCLPYIKSNAKSNYARNGLLKAINNPFGGRTEYFYSQNKEDGYCFDAPTRSVEDKVVGGVHVSKIETVVNPGDIPNVLEYKYINSDGTSSLWGLEYPTNIQRIDEHYEPQSQYVTPTGCKYTYVYSGVTRQQASSNSTTSSISNVIATVTKIAPVINQIIQIIRNPNLISAPNNVLVQYIVNFIESCQPQFEIGTTYIHSNSALNFRNSLPTQYKRIEVLNYSGTLTNGKTVYEFTSPNEFPILIPVNYYPYTNKQRAYNWVYGLPKKITVFDNNNNLVRSVENSYQLIENAYTGENTKSCNCTPMYSESKRFDEWNNSAEINSFTQTSILSNSNSKKLNVEFYNQSAGRIELRNTIEKVFKNASELTVSSMNQYSSNNYLLNYTKYTDENGREIETKLFYPEDYNLSTMPVLQSMVNDNLVNVPVSKEVWQKRNGGVPELLSSSVTEYGITPNGDYRPFKVYELKTEKPISQSIIGTFNQNQLIRDPLLILPETEFKYNYWNPGPSEIKNIPGNSFNSILYRSPDGLPIATIYNANANECEYSAVVSLTSNSTFFTKWYSTKQYKITFFADNNDKVKVATGQWNGNAWVFTDIAPNVKVSQQSGRIYYEYIIPSGQNLEIRNESSCQISEFRYYPENATMKTISYNNEGQKICESDINSHSVYYEYDGLGRLVKLMDENRNIIKTYEYHFKN